MCETERERESVCVSTRERKRVREGDRERVPMDYAKIAKLTSDAGFEPSEIKVPSPPSGKCVGES